MAAEAERQAHPNRPEPSREEEHDGKAKAVPRLRRLELVRIVAARLVVCLVALYGFAKSRAGRHRPKVDTVESMVGRVVGPVYGRFHGAPLAVLVFLDRKVDDMVPKLDRKLRSILKAALSHVYAAARAMLEVAKELLASGVAGTGPAACLQKVARIVVPTALHWAEKYNRAVARARCFPPIPTKLIAKFFSDRGVDVVHAN